MARLVTWLAASWEFRKFTHRTAQPSSKKSASTLTPSAGSPSTAAIASRAARSAAERGATTSAAAPLPPSGAGSRL
eukprot:scaffold34686_cov63-Phaeocystis_antarctica.AAC.6